MHFLFLGTGGADWDVSQANLGDKTAFHRRNTSVLVNGDLLIDPNSFVPEAMTTFGADERKIKNILISHSHGDHFNANTILWLAKDHPVTVYCDGGYSKKLPNHPNLTFVFVELEREYFVGNYRMIPVPSTHLVVDTREQAVHYILTEGGKTLFYGCDGAWLLPSAFAAISSHRYDCVILDATLGTDAQLYPIPGSQIFFNHNNPAMLQMLRAAFFNSGCADDKTIFVADHLAQTYFPSGEKAQMVFQPLGFVPAYDGMLLKL